MPNTQYYTSLCVIKKTTTQKNNKTNTKTLDKMKLTTNIKLKIFSIRKIKSHLEPTTLFTSNTWDNRDNKIETKIK